MTATSRVDDVFDRPSLELLRRTIEVEIETSRAPAATLRRTIIWVVVDTRDRVFIRSWRGQAGRWYRDVVANPTCVVRAASTTIPALAVAAVDPEQIEACSRALMTKYAGRSSTASMLSPETLVTTLRLVPR